MTDALLLLAAALPLAALLVLALGRLAYGSMIGIEILESRAVEAESIARGDLSPGELELPWEEARVESPRGYSLAVRALRGEEPRLAVFHHGICWTWVGMMRYMALFRELGWSVVALDARGHGASGGGKPSYGILEREDLGAVVDWALATYPASGGLVLVGESMGAATVLQYLPLDERIDAAVADCPYSSAVAELDHRLKRSLVPRPLRPAVIRAADWFCRRREGYSLREADSAAAILRSDAPLLLVHGLEDDYVPWSMSVAMAEKRRRARPEAVTELRLVPGARHARSVSVDRQGYAESLASFLAVALAARGKG
ncbi:MAG TPA: alpha/beta fold hydrolase [Spirochaetales bacterium]|nr:alpha/beta fold hydrolase [Spirochaetales bacterium]HRY54068.1 alpha/beta fold hydrolase [Spirochaetia bacterium]HRZ66303.1 alpha/beta fold hydrolase [Spirochaetia bacterium]